MMNVISYYVKITICPKEWPAFENYLENIRSLKRNFTSSEVIFVSRTQNKKMDSLAHSAKK